MKKFSKKKKKKVKEKDGYGGWDKFEEKEETERPNLWRKMKDWVKGDDFGEIEWEWWRNKEDWRYEVWRV